MTQNAINSKNEILQFLSTSTGAAIDCSTPVVPSDNTIPQNTEGTQVLTLTITPMSSTSTLRIVFTGMFSRGTIGPATVSLFQDSNVNALASKALNVTTAAGLTGILEYEMTSGTTSATTFKIRAGPDATNLYCNASDTGGQWMGGVASTILTIEEYT